MLVLSIVGGNLLVALAAAWLVGRWRSHWPRARCAVLASSLFPGILAAMITPSLVFAAWRDECGQDGCTFAAVACIVLFFVAAILFGMGVVVTLYLLGQTSHRPPDRHRYRSDT
ncbi:MULTISPECIES: hypothetical protein [unclassified Novosphingobium]|uniref:hypothetical protein n=1 Tax=unclassified Novosphingobium TaxID=2644732 RepID=UPI001494DCC1|nr:MULTISPECIES: hypothetical protein [unclassified Novosphingobium]MBB3360317.1 hypothetical protein [Novosphingobium sp. BK256]MBB3376574.1 hypothetical protein [Novosphingobium sp. BK280]MBB3380987.1 hypothetical protein [Novosphingobium sp. BK258]MBB3422638.1 hypothetical protein [Novosphingobium sp. BK267]MBB3451363.1 hypothetical protein [Novosphingobium sp. BK352]